MPYVRVDNKAKFWKTQLPVDYIDTSLVINTWETVSADLSGGKPARLWYMLVEQTNNGAAAEDIELEVTINGTAYTWIGSCDSGTVYGGYIQYNLSAGDFVPSLSTTKYTVASPTLSNHVAMPFVASSVGLVRVRQTSAVDGVSAQIEVNIVWDKLVGV